MMLDLLTISILVGAIGLLVVVAYLLERRSRDKGGILTGERIPVWKGNRSTYYLSLVIMLLGVGIFIKGFLDQSSTVMIIGAILGGGAYLYRFYVQRTG